MSYGGHDPTIRDVWRVHTWNITSLRMGHDSPLCGTWLTHMWDATHPYVGHDSTICGAWLTHMRDVTRHTRTLQHAATYFTYVRTHFNTLQHVRVQTCVCVRMAHHIFAHTHTFTHTHAHTHTHTRTYTYTHTHAWRPLSGLSVTCVNLHMISRLLKMTRLFFKRALYKTKFCRRDPQSYTHTHAHTHTHTHTRTYTYTHTHTHTHIHTHPHTHTHAAWALGDMCVNLHMWHVCQCHVCQSVCTHAAYVHTH